MKKNKYIGLFFGSFNPIHNGHLIIANYFVEFTDLQEVWFIVSPQNPFKQQNELLDQQKRFLLVQKAIGDYKFFKVSDIEFNLPKPSFTINTLRKLQQDFSYFRFVLIMGSDNLLSFQKWYKWQEILKIVDIYVYPRLNYEVKHIFAPEKIKIFKAPIIEISSTFIRNSIKQGKDVRFFMPPQVANLVYKWNFYKL